jgi:hypothetical protein
MKKLIFVLLLMLAASASFAADVDLKLTFTEDEYASLLARAKELEFETTEAYIKSLLDNVLKAAADPDRRFRSQALRMIEPMSPARAAKNEAAREAWVAEAARRAEELALHPKPPAPTPVPVPGRKSPPKFPKGPFATEEEREMAMEEFQKALREYRR